MFAGKQMLCIMHVCQAFFIVQPEIPVPVVITAYSDKTFTYVSNAPSILSVTDCASTCCMVAQSLPAIQDNGIMTYLTIHICNAIGKQLHVSTHARGHFTMHACQLCECPPRQSTVE